VLLSFEIIAQEKIAPQPLVHILKRLEKRYEISFTYADDNVSNISIVPPSEELSLEEVITYLNQKTNLRFQQINDRFIAISKHDSNYQDICGILIDIQSGEIIPGASIKSRDKITISNDNGFFKIENVSENEAVTIQCLGFETLNIKTNNFSESYCDTIYLRQKIIKLQEIFVTNFIIEGIDKKVDGSFVIDTEILGILPGLIEPDVLLTIQALPGIQSINETVSDINIRGGTNDQNLLLWDGIKMYQSGHFFGLISAFNPYITKNVSLIKNGTSTNFSDGVSGTIDIRTDNEVSREFSFGAGINMINADIFTRVPISPRMSIQISARRSIADMVQTPTYDKYYNRAFRDTEVINSSLDTDSILTTDENFYFYDFSLNFLYDITDKDQLRVNFLNIYNNIEYQENAQNDSIVDARTSGLEQQSLASGLSYNREWNDKFKTSALLYLSSYKLHAVNYDIINNQRLIQENEVVDTGLKLDALIGLNDNFNLLSGYQFFEVGIGNLEDINNPVFRRYIKKVVRNHAGFAEGNYISKSKKTNIRAGVRANYFPKFDLWLFEPRFAFNQNIWNFLSLEILGEMKSQTTTQIIDFQNDFLGIEKRRWILSNNDDIPVVKSRQASAGIHYQKKNLLVSLEGYYKQVVGITSSSQGFQNQFQYIRSSGNYDATGLDFLINRKFGKISSWLSYSYAENTYEFKKFLPPTFPNNLDIKHAMTFGSSYQSNHIQLSAGLNWHSGIPYTAPSEDEPIIDNEINFQDPNSSRLDDYLRLDLSAKYWIQLTHKGARAILGASLWNVLNNQNIINIYYHINDKGEIESTQRYSLGITPNFMVRVDF